MSARETEKVASAVLTASSDLERQGTVLADEVSRFLLTLRRGPLDRRTWDDPNYKGSERRSDAARAATDSNAKLKRDVAS